MPSSLIKAVLFSLALLIQAAAPAASSVALGVADDGGDSPDVVFCRLLHEEVTASDSQDVAPLRSARTVAEKGSHDDRRSCPTCQTGSSPALIHFHSGLPASPTLIIARAERACLADNVIEFRFPGVALPRAPPSLT